MGSESLATLLSWCVGPSGGLAFLSPRWSIWDSGQGSHVPLTITTLNLLAALCLFALISLWPRQALFSLYTSSQGSSRQV